MNHPHPHPPPSRGREFFLFQYVYPLPWWERVRVRGAYYNFFTAPLCQRGIKIPITEGLP